MASSGKTVNNNMLSYPRGELVSVCVPLKGQEEEKLAEVSGCRKVLLKRDRWKSVSSSLESKMNFTHQLTGPLKIKMEVFEIRIRVGIPKDARTPMT